MWHFFFLCLASTASAYSTSNAISDVSAYPGGTKCVCYRIASGLVVLLTFILSALDSNMNSDPMPGDSSPIATLQLSIISKVEGPDTGPNKNPPCYPAADSLPHALKMYPSRSQPFPSATVGSRFEVGVICPGLGRRISRME